MIPMLEQELQVFRRPRLIAGREMELVRIVMVVWECQ
jgi:hypothetical protein